MKKKNPDNRKLSKTYFTTWKKFEEQHEMIGAEYGEKEFTIQKWVYEYPKFQARRMKLFPLIFGLIYGFILIFCLYYLINNLSTLATIERPPWTIYLILGGLFAWKIKNILQPEIYITSLDD